MDAKLDEEDDNDDRGEEEDEEEAIDEEALIIAIYRQEVEPRDPQSKAFWKRHMGTDSLVASYLFLWNWPSLLRISKTRQDTKTKNRTPIKLWVT